ncbi:hypothetical protein CUMW_046090 [Citrus unshiu]|nr:hypothetical protein CUMW_046090 [Citrus unshiu]
MPAVSIHKKQSLTISLSLIITSCHFPVTIMKLFAVFVLVILFLQIAVKLAIGDARNHQEKICAIEHAELVARDATVFPQALMVTSRHALVMLASEPMEIDPSALKF